MSNYPSECAVFGNVRKSEWEILVGMTAEHFQVTGYYTDTTLITVCTTRDGSVVHGFHAASKVRPLNKAARDLLQALKAEYKEMK